MFLVEDLDLIGEVINMVEWICESCIYYPPSSFGGKPCSYCDPECPYNYYVKKDDEEVVEESEFRRYIRDEVMKQMD